MWDQILELVSRYGYFAIFGSMMLGIVGLPIPDETLLIFSGYLVTTGRLELAGTLAAGYLGAMSGITLSYVIGRTLGFSALHRYGRWIRVTPERLDRIHRWFSRFGGWTLVFGYYVAGFRHFTAFTAGTAQMSYPRFAVFAYPAAIVWVTVFVGLGYLLGENWGRASEWARKATVPILVTAIAASCVWFVVARRAAKRRATLHQ